MNKVVLGGGCFWCIDAVFKKIPGILSLVSGYAGGDYKNPSYDSVCSGRTGHAEVVELTYDPLKISLTGILEIFWKAHDPTTPNQQGNDIGSQYRSIVFYQTPEEEMTIKTSIKKASNLYTHPIVTEIKKLEIFYPGEAYHQDYFARNPNQGYCKAVIEPKLKKLDFLFLN